MKTLTKWMLAAFAGVAAVGCDPFEEAVSGPPAVIGAGFTDSHSTPYEATGSGATWTVANVPAVCSENTAGVAEVTGFIWVKFNKLLDGTQIQTSPSDCTPAAALGLNVTVTGATIPPTQRWYACYNPQSPVPNEGASVIIFLGATAIPPPGWGSALPIPGSGNAAVSVRAQGTAIDKDGASAQFDVTVPIDPDPGVPGDPTFTNFAGSSMTVSWDPACAAISSYVLQRAPNVPTGTPPVNAPGTFATIATTTPPTTTFGDTGLTPVTTYWYRVIANRTAGGTLNSGEVSVTTSPAAPAAPTFASVAATSLTVNWTAATGAATYTVERAPDVSGAPGTWATRATGLAVLTYNDTGLTTATTYWYRIVAVNPASSGSANGAQASVTTP